MGTMARASGPGKNVEKISAEKQKSRRLARRRLGKLLFEVWRERDED